MVWARVSFTAQNGTPEALLQDAAAAHLSLSEILPIEGGFSAQCPARQYRRLARIAARRRVSLRLVRRNGVFFALRPLSRRIGFWVGLWIFLPLLAASQQMIWFIDCPGMTVGEQSRIQTILRDTCGIQPGARATETKLTQGEAALLESGEFSWASMNFFRGRLTIERSREVPVPPIVAGREQDLISCADAVVLEVLVDSGTPLVKPGDSILKGQPLIGVERQDRDGTPVLQPAAGQVTGRFEWSFSSEHPLRETTFLPTGRTHRRRTLCILGREIPLSLPVSLSGSTETTIHHEQPTMFGLPLPCLIRVETVRELYRREQLLSQRQAIQRGRLAAQQTLMAEHPDAVLIAQAEQYEIDTEQCRYRVIYTVQANLCK